MKPLSRERLYACSKALRVSYRLTIVRLFTNCTINYVIVVEIAVNIVLRKALVSDVVLYSIARIFGAMA